MNAEGRLTTIRAWLEGPCGLSVRRLEKASEDASFRRYFRLTLPDGTTRIVMDAPTRNEDSRPFVSIAELLRAAGLNVPEVIAIDLAAGLLLLGDLGQRSYLDALSADQSLAPQLYTAAIEALVRLQASTKRFGHRLPAYDRTLLRRELDLFPMWFCRRHLGLEFSRRQLREWERCRGYLLDSALAQPKVIVHRDYHSRNLMVVDGNNPGVLDFQDAVCGPVSYDLVSLLKDVYIVWPPRVRTGWFDEYLRLAAAAGIPTGDGAAFRASCNRMGIQRHLKVAGIFARLFHRDGKARYLGDLPVVIEYLLEALATEAELEFVRDYLATRCLPRMELT